MPVYDRLNKLTFVSSSKGKRNIPSEKVDLFVIFAFATFESIVENENIKTY